MWLVRENISIIAESRSLDDTIRDLRDHIEKIYRHCPVRRNSPFGASGSRLVAAVAPVSEPDSYQGHYRLSEQIRVVEHWTHATCKFDEALTAVSKEQ